MDDKSTYKKPNLFIVGAAKSGTSAFYQYLKQHHQIFMSPVKEPHFFSFEEKLLYSNGPGDKKRMKDAVSKMKDYISLFSGSYNFPVIGEASTTYLDSEIACKRIYEFNPNAKIIIILRHPAERAFASFLHNRRDGLEIHNNFNDALNDEEKRISLKWGPLWHYKNRQLCYNKIHTYFSTFKRQNIKIILYEEWKEDNLRILKETYQFLDVHNDFKNTDLIKSNVGYNPRFEFFHILLTKENFIKKTFKSILPQSIRKSIRLNLAKINYTKPTLPHSIKRELIEFYRDDIVKLQKLMDKDLSHWLH